MDNYYAHVEVLQNLGDAGRGPPAFGAGLLIGFKIPCFRFLKPK